MKDAAAFLLNKVKRGESATAIIIDDNNVVSSNAPDVIEKMQCSTK